MGLFPGDHGNERAAQKWVATRLNWWIETPTGRRYPDVNRVKKAQEDGEFQRQVPGITIKVRNRGDIRRPTAPLSVARQVMPVLSDHRVKTKLDDLPSEQAQKVREDFLRAYANTESKKRKDLKDAFLADPLKPVVQIIDQIGKERAQQIVVAFKASPELVDRIDSHSKTMDGWTRSDAVKDLVDQALRELGL